MALIGCLCAYTFKNQSTDQAEPVQPARYPPALDDVNAWYPEPTGPNAAVVYERAFAAYSDDTQPPSILDFGRTSQPGVPEHLSPSQAQQIESYLQKNAEALALLEEATALAGCRFEVRVGPYGDMVLPHLGYMRHGIGLLSIAAQWEITQARWARASMDLAVVDGLYPMVSERRGMVLPMGFLRGSCWVESSEIAVLTIFKAIPPPESPPPKSTFFV